MVRNRLVLVLSGIIISIESGVRSCDEGRVSLNLAGVLESAVWALWIWYVIIIFGRPNC